MSSPIRWPCEARRTLPSASDELVSLPKNVLTHFVGMLPPDKLRMLDRALLIALQIEAD